MEKYSPIFCFLDVGIFLMLDNMSEKREQHSKDRRIEEPSFELFKMFRTFFLPVSFKTTPEWLNAPTQELVQKAFSRQFTTAIFRDRQQSGSTEFRQKLVSF